MPPLQQPPVLHAGSVPLPKLEWDTRYSPVASLLAGVLLGVTCYKRGFLDMEGIESGVTNIKTTAHQRANLLSMLVNISEELNA